MGCGVGNDGKPPVVRELAVQTAQLVAESRDPLSLLVNITSTFPALVRGISKIKVNQTFVDSVEGMGRMVRPGANYLLVNGLAVRTPTTHDLRSYNG